MYKTYLTNDGIQNFLSLKQIELFIIQLGNYAGISLVAFSALMSNTEGDTQIWEYTWDFYVPVSAPLIGGLLIANVLASALTLEKPERV